MRYSYRQEGTEYIQDFDYPIGEAPESFEYNGMIWHRVFSLAGVVFRGPGFYTTDKRPYIDADSEHLKIKGDKVVGRR